MSNNNVSRATLSKQGFFFLRQSGAIDDDGMLSKAINTPRIRFPFPLLFFVIRRSSDA